MKTSKTCKNVQNFFVSTDGFSAGSGAAAGNLAAGAHRFGLLFAVSTAVAVVYAIATSVARARYVERE